MQRKSIIKRSVKRSIRPKKEKSEKMMIKSRLFSHIIDSEFDYNGEISVEISAKINLFASTRRWHRKRIIILTLKNRRIPMHENPTAASQGRTRCIWAKTPIHVLRKPRPAIWNKELNNLALKIVGNFETQHGRYFGRDETTWFVSSRKTTPLSQRVISMLGDRQKRYNWGFRRFPVFKGWMGACFSFYPRLICSELSSTV